jgi:hypothetical protein
MVRMKMLGVLLFLAAFLCGSVALNVRPAAASLSSPSKEFSAKEKKKDGGDEEEDEEEAHPETAGVLRSA